MKQAAIALIIRQTNIPTFPVGYRREILAVTNRKYNTLTLPGGKLDRLPDGSWETPDDAVVREVREETHLEVSRSDLVYIGSGLSQNLQDLPDVCFVSFYFASAVTGMPASVEKGTDIVWCSFDELVSESFFAPYYKTHLPSGIDTYPATVFRGAV